MRASKNDDTQIKIADFGLARMAPEKDSLKTLCGSPYYISPEILRRDRYGTKTDMWSVGVVIFILLGGYPPFSNEDREVLYKQIKDGKYTFIDTCWGAVSDQAKEFIKSMLVIDPMQRLCAVEAVRHPWMRVDQAVLRKNSLQSSQRSIENKFVIQKFKDAVKRGE